MKTISPTCRFCGQTLSIALPDDERMAKFIGTLAGKACCNRCADFRRKLRDLGDVVQKSALDLGRVDQDGRNDVVARIKRGLGAVVKVVEDHYLVSGYARFVDEFTGNILDRPDTARWQIQIFTDGVRDEARRIHQ